MGDLAKYQHRARLHALDYRSSQRLVFTGNSALLLHGITTWSAEPSCVEAWPSKSDSARSLSPAVRRGDFGGASVPVICRAKLRRASLDRPRLEMAESTPEVEAVIHVFFPQRATRDALRSMRE